MVTSMPSNKIVVLRFALTELEADALAALLAHELSHLKHGDPMAAAVRHYGHLGVWGVVFEGEDLTRDRVLADVQNGTTFMPHAGGYPVPSTAWDTGDGGVKTSWMKRPWWRL